jgi:uncharacterized protein
VSAINVSQRKSIGETDLARLLSGMKPMLQKGSYVFCRVPSRATLEGREPLATFVESEGMTVIIEHEQADALGLVYTYRASWITLTVNSSLEAVGLTASVSAELARARISCNVFAAFHHDHIFVDKADGERACRLLEELSAKSAAEITPRAKE